MEEAMHRMLVLAAGVCILGLSAAAVVYARIAGSAGEAPSVERGRYLVKIAGCNDCHTPNYALQGGQVPEALWLTGDELGWRGAWGTTYPTNLRLYFTQLSEEEWVQRAATLTARPPMPWFNVRDMSEPDLRSLYRYVRALGPAGAPAPAYVPPGREPHGPVIAFPHGTM
jgi:mono/diheme cytochrome c family protein